MNESIIYHDMDSEGYMRFFDIFCSQNRCKTVIFPKKPERNAYSFFP